MRQRQTTRLTSRPVVQFICCLAIALLPACQRDDPDSPFRRHLNQLGLALSAAAPAGGSVAATPPPAAWPVQLALQPGTIDTLEFAHLSGCAVQANIGKRQTDLARFAKPSQRLLLALEFLRLAPSCITRLRDGERHRLAAELATAWEQTRRELPALIFNATLGSDEYRAFWLDTPATGAYPRSDPGAATAALNEINRMSRRWLHGDYRTHPRELELALSEIAGGRGGELLARWSRQTHWLRSADMLIRQAVSTADCGKTSSIDAMTVRRLTAARGYFIGELQPLVTLAQTNYLRVQAPIVTLESQLGGTLPERYRSWQADRRERAAALASASPQHLAALGHILRCLQE